jgi:hypothetical protein
MAVALGGRPSSYRAPEGKRGDFNAAGSLFGGIHIRVAASACPIAQSRSYFSGLRWREAAFSVAGDNLGATSWASINVSIATQVPVSITL